MSFVGESGDGGSVSSMSDSPAQDGANSGHGSSRTSASSLQQDGDLGDAGSESESYVEVEQLGEDVMPGPANFAAALTTVTSPARTSPPPCNVVRHVTKRTLITLHQRSVLEEYYRNGMTSASQQLAEIHEQVAGKTGLDLSVVRNWIRNRRRPNAAKMAEKMAEKIAAYGIPGIPVTSSSFSTAGAAAPLPTLIPSHHTSSLTPLSTLPHTVVVTATNHHHMATPGLIHVNTDSAHALPHPTPMTFGSIPQIAIPEPKRVCLEPNNYHHYQHNHHTNNSPSSPHPSSSPSSLLVKVRVCGSGECDFVEVEVGALTYLALVAACCEELELTTTDVAKIRKLPNVLVRKDRDVQRMKDGQELEVVLKSDLLSSSTGNAVSVISPPAAAASGAYSTSMLTVNPFSAPNAAAVLALTQNQALVQRGGGGGGGGGGGPGGEGLGMMKPPEENGTVTNHHVVPALTSDSSEIHNHTHSTTTVVNGLQ